MLGYRIEDAVFLIVARVVANRGEPIVVPESGVLGDGLPRLDKRALGPLRRAGYLTVTETGGGVCVAPGPRILEIARRWNIALHEHADGDGR